MHRRRFLPVLGALIGVAATSAGFAHTPYRQWAVFRQRFLLITTTRDDAGADALGEDIARVLLERLPASQAQVSRARDWKTLASLLVTRQTELAVMAHARADALFTGVEPYQDFGPSPLRVVVQNAQYRLVCREDFPKHHAFLLSEALMQEAAALGFAIPAGGVSSRIPAHPGARAFAAGEALPAAPVDEKEVRRAQ